MTLVPAAAVKSTKIAMANKTNDLTDKIKPIAIPGIHDKFYIYLINHIKSYTNPSILDLGAGHGYLVKRLHEDGFNVNASDLFPESYYYDKVPCHKADLTQVLPFANESFDVLLAVEVMEHIFDHELFFREAHRILKKGGVLFFTTPNILSLKSRFRFLFSGFFYSFSPLDYNRNDGLQHTASLTVDQYRYLATKNQFTDIDISFDKRQSTSCMLTVLIPFIRLYCKMKSIKYSIHNNFDYLTGRILFVKIKK